MSVRRSVRWSVGRSVGPSVGNAFVKIAKSNGKSSFFACMLLFCPTEDCRIFFIFFSYTMTILFILFLASYRVACPQLKTSDAGSQYRCGRVGRGIQPPASPQPHPQLPTHTLTHTNTQCNNCSIINARFSHFQLERDGPTNRPTDRPTDRRTWRT